MRQTQRAPGSLVPVLASEQTQLENSLRPARIIPGQNDGLRSPPARRAAATVNMCLSSFPKHSEYFGMISRSVVAFVCCILAGPVQAERGLASIYGNGDGYAWKKTASGQRMNPHAMTAAHRTLPLGSRVRVVNRRNGKKVMVRINDRGPFVRGRVIDLSPAAAHALGFSGLAPVTVLR